ncbi:MAG: Multidrug resistance protein MdtL [Holosporales bacterium]
MTYNQNLGILLVATVALMIGGIDIYAPTLPYLVRYFNSTPEALQFTVTLSPLVSAVVSFFWGRQADRQCHKTLMLLAIILFGVGATLCAMSTHITMFIFGRLIQAIGGSGLSILTVVLLYDLFHSEKDHARYMAVYGAMFPAVFAVAPLLGAQLFEIFHWQSCFIFVSFVCVIFFALYALFLPRKKMIEVKESKTPAIKDIAQLFFDKRFMGYVFGHALPVSISMLFTVNSSFIFQTYFCFSPTLYAVVQAIPIALNFIGAFYYRHLLKSMSVTKTIRIASYSVMLFAIGLFLQLVLPINVSPLSLILVMSIFTFFMSFSISSCYTKAIESRTGDRGIAIATVSTMRNLSGSFFVIVGSQFYTGTPLPMLIFMLGLALTLGSILTFLSRR